MFSDCENMGRAPWEGWLCEQNPQAGSAPWATVREKKEESPSLERAGYLCEMPWVPGGYPQWESKSLVPTISSAPFDRSREFRL